jgi:hypothetical protein
MYPTISEHGTFIGRRETWAEARTRVGALKREAEFMLTPPYKPVYTIRKGPLGWSFYLRIVKD